MSITIKSGLTTMMKIINERGYLITGSPTEEELGKIHVGIEVDVDGNRLDQPFQVISRTTLEDLEEQRQLWHEIESVPLPPLPEEFKRWFYYRLHTD